MTTQLSFTFLTNPTYPCSESRLEASRKYSRSAVMPSPSTNRFMKLNSAHTLTVSWSVSLARASS